MAGKPKKTDAEEAREMIERERRYAGQLKKYRDAMGVEYDFALKLTQLKPNMRRELERQGRQPVVTLDLTDIVRYKSAKLAGEPIYLDVKLNRPGKTPQETALLMDAAQVAKGVMWQKIHDLDIGYPRLRRGFVRMGVAARAGAIKLEIVNGTVQPSRCDPRELTWDPIYTHFNEPGCPELCETIHPTLAWVKAQKDWQNTENLKPDDGEKIIVRSAPPNVDKDAPQATEEQTITLKVFWIKCDDDEVEVEENEPRALDPSRWYMACGECGYTESDLVNTPGYDGSKLPESQACPQCGSTPEGMPVAQMHRHDHEMTVGKMPAYPDGHRMVVVAAFQPEEGYLVDRPWPKKLRNFPYGMFVPDPFPIEPFGNSDTFYNMDLQSLKNRAFRNMGEQFERNRDLLIAREDVLWDDQHEPYQFDGSGDTIAFYSGDAVDRDIKQFQGSGLNPAASAWIGILNEELNAHRGIGEVSLTPEQLKGTPVGSIAQSQESGDVPLDECARILREMEEQLFNRWLELELGCMTEDEWFEIMGQEGEMEWRLFSAASAPDMKLSVQASPNLNLVDKMQIDTVKSLQGAPAGVIRLAGQGANLPKNIVDELIAASAPPVSGAGPPMNPAGMAPGGVAGG